MDTERRLRKNIVRTCRPNSYCTTSERVVLCETAPEVAVTVTVEVPVGVGVIMAVELLEQLVSAPSEIVAAASRIGSRRGFDSDVERRR